MIYKQCCVLVPQNQFENECLIQTVALLLLFLSRTSNRVVWYVFFALKIFKINGDILGLAYTISKAIEELDAKRMSSLNSIL